MILLATHLLAVGIGALMAGAYMRVEFRKRELAAEYRGMMARVIAHDPCEAFRLAEGAPW